MVEPLQIEGIGNCWDKTWEHLSISHSCRTGLDYEAQVTYNRQFLAPYATKSVLEVGAGSGYFSLQMAQAGASVTLLDISPKALEIASSLFMEQATACQLIRADGLSLPLRSNSFDIVWNGGVLEHFYDEGKVKLLQEMKRVTKPGGTVLVSCPNKWDIPFYVAKKWGDLRGNWPYGYEELVSPLKLRRLFRQANMYLPRIVCFDPITGWWFLPRTRGLLHRLGLEKPYFHHLKTPVGHVIYAIYRKPKVRNK